MRFPFWKRKKTFLYDEAAKWLDHALAQDIPENAVAFCFNLYDDGNHSWSMELIASQRFDKDDTDWACDEVTDFGTREKNFVWKQKAEWDTVLQDVISALKKYLSQGKNAEKLKSGKGIGAGFVDGDIFILYPDAELSE